MKPLPITVIILVHRNDENLKKAINSASFASEILIVDNNSGVDWSQFKDAPLKILTEKEPITNFSKIRNQATKEASNEWVFFLDSDEEVVQPVVPKLAAILASHTTTGAVLFRSDMFLGKKLSYGEAGHQQLVRIGKKDSIRFTGNVHEVASINGNLMYSRVELLHHAHPSINEFIDDVSSYAQIVAATKTTSFAKNLLEMLVFPPTKFLYNLIIQGGISDGWRGVVYASCMSLHSLLVRIYRYELLANNQKHS